MNLPPWSLLTPQQKSWLSWRKMWHAGSKKTGESWLWRTVIITQCNVQNFDRKTIQFCYTCEATWVPNTGEESQLEIGRTWVATCSNSSIQVTSGHRNSTSKTSKATGRRYRYRMLSLHWSFHWTTHGWHRGAAGRRQRDVARGWKRTRFETREWQVETVNTTGQW